MNRPIYIRLSSVENLKNTNASLRDIKKICQEKGMSLTVINGLGRKSLNVRVKNVCDALQSHPSVAAAARKLGCSRAYIYKVLGANGLKAKGFVGRRVVSKQRKY